MSSENKSISTVLAIAACALSLAANADTFWKGGGATTDWDNSDNWYQSGGNYVFGGAQVGQLPDTDPIVVTFSTPVSASGGVWIENENKPDIVWRVSDQAEDGAGFTTSFTSSKWGKAINVGTGKHGGLTIEGGVYYFPSELWIGNGAADSYFTLNGGVFTNQSYTCIGYGGYSRTATMTVNGGTFRQNSNTFIVGQGNHSGCKGVFNLISGSVDTAANATCSENQGTSEMNISGGSFKVGGQLMLAEGKSGAATTTMDISGGTIKVVGFSRAAVGSNSSATITMSDGTFDTDNEFVLASGTGSTAEMTLSGGTFTPRKFWVGSHYSYTGSGCTANFTMTGGTLETDNDQDIVVGGNANAVGTFNMQGGTVNCGNTFHIAWNGSGTVNMSGGDIYLRSGKNLYFAEHGTSATMNFTGGTIHTDNIVMGTGDTGTATTSLTVNGGSFAPVTDKADWLSGVPMTVGANGIGLASGGHSATLSANLTPAAEEQPIKAVFTGADRTGVISFSSSTFEQIDSFEIASNGVMVVAMGGTVEKPLKIDADGTLVVDVSGQILTDGDYDLVKLSGGLVDTTVSSANVDIAGLPGVATLTYTVENNVLKVNVSGLERMVLNVNGGEWTAADTWKGETSGTVRAFGAKDRAAFVIAEDDTVQTVLVNTDVAPLGVDVEVTGENSYALIKGHGTFAPAELCVKGTIGLAGDAEGPLNLDVALERTLEGDVDVSKALFAEGTVNLLTSLHMDSTVNGKVVRGKDWTPSYKIDGTGELVIDACKLTLNNTTQLAGFAGNVVLTNNARLSIQPGFDGTTTLGASSHLKMAGGVIERFGIKGGSNNETVWNVEVVEGTDNEWYNRECRGGNSMNLDFRGSFTGAGYLLFNSRWDGGRRVRFYTDFTGFTGTMRLTSDGRFDFNAPIKGGTIIADNGVNIISSAITVDGGALLLNNDCTINGSPAISVSSSSTFGGCATTKVRSVTFSAGAKFRFTAEDALTDMSQTYVGLTTTEPISGPLPILENADNERGKWKLVVREIPAETEEGSPTYQLVASFRPMGFNIIIN